MLMLLSIPCACSSECAAPGALEALQPIGRGSNQRGTRCDDVNGNPLHQVFEAALSNECLHEPWFLQRIQQVECDAASHIYSTCRENLQREIAGFARQNRNQDVNRCLTQFAGLARVDGGVNNCLCMILGRRDQLSNFWPFRYLLLVAQKFVNIGTPIPEQTRSTPT